jgi:hypothetical protein
MTLPNFLVIGAGRAGTTSLHHYFDQHPEVFMPQVKSPSHFFCRGMPRIEAPELRWVTKNYFVPDPDDYEALFDGVRGEKAIGEVSPVYLATIHAAPRIAQQIPEARLIAMLRHPADRIHARFVGRHRDGLERRSSLAEVVRDELFEPLVQETGFGTYLAAGCCHHFLASYYDRFPRERIRIHLFEDFQEDPRAVMADLFEFLEVDATFAPDISTRHNRSGGTIRNPLLRLIWTRSALPRALIRPYVPLSVRRVTFGAFTGQLDEAALDPELRAELTSLFLDDIGKLQELIDRDLSHWLA